MTDTLGDYQLITTLGRGGMADVYLAARHRHGGFTKLVVIKRLRADLFMSPDGPLYRQLLLDEANLAARLHHPNIVQTHEVHDDVGAPYLVMEYLDGQPLTQVVTAALRAGQRVPVRLALHVVAEVLAGLEHAHALCDYDGAPLAVVHRDVSPHNVFWTYAGDVKLMDFGVARSALGASLTVAGTVKGKLGYMAPEQARGEAIDHRADLFAAGIVLWELLAGRRFLRAESDAGAMHKLLYEPLPSLAEVRPSLDPLVVAVVERALERDPVRRYPSAALMRADVERVLGGRAPRREDLAAFVAPLFAAAREERAARIVRSRPATASSPIVTAAPSSPAHVLPVASDREPTAPVEVAAAPVAVPATAPAARGRGRWGAAVVAAVAVVAVAAAVVAGRGRATPPGARPAEARQPASGAAPAAPPAPVPPTLRLCGSNTVGAELAPALVEAFLRRRGAPAVARAVDATGQALRATLPTGEVVVDVRAEGSATAFTGLAAGRCDVGLASRPINDDEAARLEAAGFGDPRRPAIEHVIALDGIAVIVHPDNPIATLDRAALRGVFTGAITDWAALGGAPGPIVVLARDDRSGTFDTFKHLVLGATPLAAAAGRFADSAALADAVARDPRAIGFVGLAYVRGARAVAIGDAGAAPLLPTSVTVGTEAYLLARRLFAYSAPRPATPLAAELVAFALSPAGQEVVARAGFVDLAVALVDAAPCDAACPRDYAAQVAGARRLSLDFRFRRGEDALDSRGSRDLDRVVQFLHDHPDARVLLFGFSDSSGGRDANRRLAQARADAVARALATRGVHAAVVRGLGAARPVADNRDAAGRERNRRVEIWLGR
ncbi:MAG: substrate-binding domain-containing protein [Myxococcales bacterium]|nr:substrate-binding domain-containing protein [Myxococcales bacterium]